MPCEDIETSGALSGGVAETLLNETAVALLALPQ